MENKQLLAALFEFNKECPKIDKSKTADMVKFKYKFAPLDIILDIVKPILMKHGLFITQCLNGGKSITTTLYHVSGEKLQSTFAWESQSWVFTDVGKEITYYKRYAICALLNLSIGDEDQDAQGKKDYRELTKDEKKVLLPYLDKNLVNSNTKFIPALNEALVKIDKHIWNIDLRDYLGQYYTLAPGIIEIIEDELTEYRKKYYV